VAVGDFNGDGKLDLALANTCGSDPDCSSNGTVSILLGKGDGTFQTHVDYPTGFKPQSVAVGDFNGDGKLDLAVTNRSDSTVSILLGRGDGTFQTHVDYATGTGAVSVTAGDFNGDGRPDLAVAAGFGNKTVSILLGNGDGTFQAHLDYPSGNGPLWVTTGDFNGDGALDLATANLNCPFVPCGPNGTVSVFLNIPVIALFPTKLPFGKEPVGTTSEPKAVLLSNPSPVPLKVASIAIAGTDAGDFAETNTCGARIKSGTNCSIGVTFAPKASATRTAVIAIADNALARRQMIALTGVGIAAEVKLSPASLTFATELVGTTSAPKKVTLTNSGNARLEISSIATSGDFAQTNDCGSSVAAGKSCTINVTFAPKAKGARTGAVTITDNAPDSPQKIVLAGTGTVVKHVPSSLNFGSQPVGTKSAPRMVTLTNTGSTALSISGIAITGTNASDFVQTNTCDGSVGAGKSCSLCVTFKPTAKGSRSAAVSVSDDGGGSPQKIALAGTGT
jgi:hypothetical protein